MRKGRRVDGKAMVRRRKCQKPPSIIVHMVKMWKNDEHARFAVVGIE